MILGTYCVTYCIKINKVFDINNVFMINFHYNINIYFNYLTITTVFSVTFLSWATLLPKIFKNFNQSPSYLISYTNCSYKSSTVSTGFTTDVFINSVVNLDSLFLQALEGAINIPGASHGAPTITRHTWRPRAHCTPTLAACVYNVL